MSLPKKTVEALADWLLKRKIMATNAPLFTSVDFKNEGHRLTGDGIYKIVKRLFKRAGVEKHIKRTAADIVQLLQYSKKLMGTCAKHRNLVVTRPLETLQVYDDNRNRDAPRGRALPSAGDV